MGRPKTKYLDLPPLVTARTMKSGKILYYYGPNKIPLGDDKQRALRQATRVKSGAISLKDLWLGSMTGLPMEEEEIISKAIPATKHCGIYFLINHSEIVYIGQSTDALKRITDHIREGSRLFDSFSWIMCPKDRLLETEAFYINRFKPKLNVSIPQPMGLTLVRAPLKIGVDHA